MNRVAVKSKNIKSAEKASENLNEKIFVVFLLFEARILKDFIEEITQIKLQNQQLEIIKKKILEISSQNQYSFDLEYLSDLNENSEPFFKEIDQLKKTHLKDLGNEEKVRIFKKILNNLKLPELIKERIDLKEKILLSSDSNKQSQLIKQYDEILSEIKNIKNKLLE